MQFPQTGKCHTEGEVMEGVVIVMEAGKNAQREKQRQQQQKVFGGGKKDSSKEEAVTAAQPDTVEALCKEQPRFVKR